MRSVHSESAANFVVAFFKTIHTASFARPKICIAVVAFLVKYIKLRDNIASLSIECVAC